MKCYDNEPPSDEQRINMLMDFLQSLFGKCKNVVYVDFSYKMLSYRRETMLHGA